MLKTDVAGGEKGENFPVQRTVGGDGREAVVTEAKSADGDYGSLGELRKVNEPRAGRECRLYHLAVR